MSLPLKLVYKQSCSAIEQSISINIDEWHSKTIQDVKNIIESSLSIPCCVQRLFYPREHLIIDNSIELKSLYLRDNDEVYLEYLAVIDIIGMDASIDRLASFVQEIDRWHEEKIFEIRDVDQTEFPDYEGVTNATEKLAFQHFVPWKNPLSLAGRHYFVQKGGFDKLLEVFKFTEQRYKCIYDFNADNTYSIRELGAVVDYYNNEQMVLQMHCLTLLWNFSETDVHRKHALQHNGLQIVCEALLRDSTAYSTDDDMFWVINGINETAVGCLVQYAEYPSSQDILAKDKRSINKLVYMVENRLHRETTFYQLYSSQIAANTLFLCACNSKTPAILVENEVHLRVIGLTKRLLEEDHDIALRYYCSLFLARIAGCPLVELSPDVNQQINELIETFLKEHTAQEVSSWEEQHNYVWVTMLPFVSLTFAGGPFANGQCTTENIPGPGTQAVQQMGLFSVDHMSRLKENIELLRRERLVPYLTCLSWNIKESEKTTVDTILQRLPSSEPPLLSVIAKSQLARMKGLEVAICLRA